jgi:hypothetical protein
MIHHYHNTHTTFINDEIKSIFLEHLQVVTQDGFIAGSQFQVLGSATSLKTQ